MGAIHPSLAGWWRGENTALDASGNARNGTWVGTEAYAAGKHSRGLSLNGASRVGCGSVVASGAWTIAAWINSATADQVIHYPFTWSGTDGIWWGGTNASFTNKWGIYDGTTVATSTAAGGAGAWRLLTVTKSGTSYAMYLDAVAAGTATLLDRAVSAFIIGSRAAGDRPVTATIDGVMVWSRALAAHEIRQLYATGSPLGLLK
jgi:hypothetical protein